MSNEDKVTPSHRVESVYQSGMQLANALRLVGKHEDAHEVELWVLSLMEELK